MKVNFGYNPKKKSKRDGGELNVDPESTTSQLWCLGHRFSFQHSHNEE